METIFFGHVYRLFKLGSTRKQSLRIEIGTGVKYIDLLDVVIDRTKYLDTVLSCNESKNAICFLEQVRVAYCSIYGVYKKSISVSNKGHIYNLPQINRDKQTRLVFVKRSGGAITYEKEWPGIQTQEVLRVLIDHTKFLMKYSESSRFKSQMFQEMLLDLQNALFSYEVRAYRRKQEKVNRKEGIHDDSIRPKAWKPNVFDDIPFTVTNIEDYLIGEDGHIVFAEKS